MTTTCRRGHPQTPENRTHRPDRPGTYRCRACIQESYDRRRAAGKLRRTHCVAGHEYTPETIGIDPAGRRTCRQCASDREAVRGPRPPSTRRPDKQRELEYLRRLVAQDEAAQRRRNAARRQRGAA
jgi:hypothetical protein